MLLSFSTALLRAADAFNPDDLPHASDLLPNGTRVTIITLNGVAWRAVEPSYLTSADADAGDVCFEAKFDSLQPPDKIKLFGLNAVLVVEETSKLKALATAKRLDNVFVCGNVQGAGGAPGTTFAVAEIYREAPDEQRYASKLAALDKAQDWQALIDLGQHIDQQLKQNQVIVGFSNYTQLEELREKAYLAALAIREKIVKPEDADGLYALALAYKDLPRGKRVKYQEYILKCLAADPDHRKAGAIAEQEFGLVKFEGKYLRKEEAEKIKADREAARLIAGDAKRQEAEQARRREAEAASADRAALLLKYEAALRTSEPRAREGALETLGAAVQKSADPGFGQEVVEILVNTSDPAAIYPGLDLVAKSPLPEVRAQVSAALTWRGSLNDATAQFALDTLSTALRNEKDANIARAAIDGLKILRRKAAIQVLMASLDAADFTVAGAVIEALQAQAHQPFTTKDAWRQWWNENKGKIE